MKINKWKGIGMIFIIIILSNWLLKLLYDYPNSNLLRWFCVLGIVGGSILIGLIIEQDVVFTTKEVRVCNCCDRVFKENEEIIKNDEV